MAKYLYGIHDPGGEHLMADAPGTIVYTIDVRNDAPIDFRPLAAQGFRAVVRPAGGRLHAQRRQCA